MNLISSLYCSYLFLLLIFSINKTLVSRVSLIASLHSQVSLFVSFGREYKNMVVFRTLIIFLLPITSITYLLKDPFIHTGSF